MSVDDVIQVQDQFYILATASKATERTATLKHDDTFAVFDYWGDIGAFGTGEQGLYHEGTRYLSRFRLRLNGHRPLLLSARVKDENELFGADVTNPDISLDGTGLVLARDLIHLFRGRFIWDATWHERIRIWNYSRGPVRVSLTFDVDADFADIFEVRGATRARRGARLAATNTTTEMRLGYAGLDGEERWTVLDWSEPPAAIGVGKNGSNVRFDYNLPPRSPASLSVAIRCEREHRRVTPRSYELAESEVLSAIKRSSSEYAAIDTSSERFNRWLCRSAADLRMLVSATPHGAYPYAGVPWFSTPFGRDGIITALQTLWVNPRIARGVLEYLAATQADHTDPERDAEPGKILHETRNSEMARLGEVPFGQYYGSVDATPLFVVLASAYYERTLDLGFLRRIWTHVERALDWIDSSGDIDGDGFVEYARRSPTGLIQQGWKDSQDSVFHADGTLAEAPIALCEVQGYVFDARVRAARLADVLGDLTRGERLRRQASDLQARFEAHFWCEEESTYALALDGRKQPCRVRSSNAGHCLFSGIAAPERARAVANGLVRPEMCSGWGVRTLSSLESRYNPMSYHNGSVWPHDNGLLVAGLSRYHFDDVIGAPIEGLFDASGWMDGHRLPELFCGFHRRPGEGPTLYPVACTPQAWAAGVVFHLVQSCLRLSIDAAATRLTIDRPLLPPRLTSLRLLNLDLPFGGVDLLFERHAPGVNDVNVTVLRKDGQFDVHVIR